MAGDVRTFAVGQTIGSALEEMPDQCDAIFGEVVRVPDRSKVSLQSVSCAAASVSSIALIS